MFGKIEVWGTVLPPDLGDDLGYAPDWPTSDPTFFNQQTPLKPLSKPSQTPLKPIKHATSIRKEIREVYQA